MRIVIYTLRRRPFMRSIRLAMHADGTLHVSAARSISVRIIEQLIKEKTSWIEKHREKMLTRPPRLAPASSRIEYLKRKEEAKKIAEDRVAHFSKIYGVTPLSISIRHTRTRWGSCSRRGRINFSYRLVFLSSHLRDYLVVHELCHLKEFNHSVRFWALVAKTMPEYRALRHELRLA